LDTSLEKLASFVGSKDSRLACAAAVILTELAPKDSKITRQLVQCLEHADSLRRPFIIEALGRIGTAEAAEALVPLVKSEGAASDQALRAIAHTASAALKPLLKLIGTVPAALLERIAECVARTGENVAYSGLLAGLRNADVDTCRAIRNGLRSAMSGFDDKNKSALSKHVDHAFRDKELVRHHPSLIALMKIAGDLGDVMFQSEIVDHVDKENAMDVRRAALQALARLHLSPAQRARLAPKLIPILFESDLPNLAEPALEALRQAQLGADHHSQVRKLLNSPSSRIREFAMQALASQGTTRTLNELITCLDSPDRALREEALGALSRAPAAAAPLCERLLGLHGGDAALETARALAPQAAKIPSRMLDTLAAHYVNLAAGNGNGMKKPGDPDGARKNDEMKRAILSVFRSANAPQLVESAVERARKLRKDDEPMRSYELLKAVSGLHGWNDDYRIELAMAGLGFGHKDLVRAARSSDMNLRVFEDILASGKRSPKDLAKFVLKESALSKKTLYYIGFHFVERMQNDRQYGQLILEELAESRTEEGRQAKEKLIIEGLAAVKSGKAGILEERAKVMMTAQDMVADEDARQEKKRTNEKAAAVVKPKVAVQAKPKAAVVKSAPKKSPPKSVVKSGKKPVKKLARR